MDSFEQQMLDEIERRYREYELSKSISFDNENTTEENENEDYSNIQQPQIIFSKLNNAPDLDDEKSVKIETEPITEQKVEINHLSEMIYANNSVIKCNKSENSLKSDTIPVGRKPALPPKPPNRAVLILGKPKGLVQSARAAIFDRKTPHGKIDPAEMSLKERLALFEKNKGNALVPKASLAMSETRKQMINNTKKNCDLLTVPLLPDISNQKLAINGKSETQSSNIENNTNDFYELAVKEITDTFEQTKKNSSKIQTLDIKMQLSVNADVLKRDSVSPKSAHSPPPTPPTLPTPLKTDKPQNKRRLYIPETEPHIEAKVNTFRSQQKEGELCQSRRKNNIIEIRENKLNNGARIESMLYGDLTPIVTSVAQGTMKPDETIGLNDLHQSEPNCSLLNDFNQYQPKEEDRWDKFIECLLFFCCVA